MVSMERTCVARLAVLAVAAGFAAQTVLLLRFSEPYPALLMPGFGSAGPAAPGQFVLGVPEIRFVYADGTSRQLTPAQLLAALPVGHRGPVMASLFAPLADVSSQVASSQGGDSQRLFPGLHLAERSRAQPAWRRSMAQWLRARAATFHPGSPPIFFRVDRIEETLREPASESIDLPLERRTDGIFLLDLEDDHAG